MPGCYDVSPTRPTGGSPGCTSPRRRGGGSRAGAMPGPSSRRGRSAGSTAPTGRRCAPPSLRCPGWSTHCASWRTHEHGDRGLGADPALRRARRRRLGRPLGRRRRANPLKLLGVLVVVLLGAAFFCCLSVTIAGLVLKRDRLMGIGQAIMMPLFFASNALYPVTAMPYWLQVISAVNPLSYEVSALRGLLLGTPTTLWLDFLVLILAALGSITAASALLGRLTR